MNKASKLLTLVLCTALCAGCAKKSDVEEKGSASEALKKQETADKSSTEQKQNTISVTEGTESGIDWTEAETTPYGKYPEEVTYTLGQMSTTTNSNLPEGDSYEDNAYTRYLKNFLNIQNESVYIEQQDRYDEYINVIVKDRDLPDVLVLSNREILMELVENDLVEDLTEAYENCTTPRIKEMFDSYGEELLKAGTFEGRLLAIPETVIDHGPCLMWLRKDWMEKLELSEPENLEEAIEIVDAFVKNKMGAEEGAEAIGLVCDTSLVGTTSTNFSVDPIFDSFGASPQRWLEKDGEILYGSLTEETRSAIAFLRELYEREILDQDFVLRAQNNIRDLVIEGKCGAFFGLWWAPSNPLLEAMDADEEADWKPYYFGIGRPENTYEAFRDNKYVVVRKGYEHPEIVMKIISVLFDHTRYDADDADEVNGYFALNVEPSARPLVINVDYNEAAFQVTGNIRKALQGELPADELNFIEKPYYEACLNYLSGERYTVNDWSAYEARVDAVGLLIDRGYITDARKYLDNADGEIPRSLQTFEKNAFIQMIMGEKPMEYFEEFVEEWYRQGGEELTEKIRMKEK